MKNNKLLPAAGAIALLLVAVLLAITVIAVLYSVASPGTKAPQGYITVSASGFASAPPSQALLYITVNGTGATVYDAVYNMSAAMQSVNATIVGYVHGNMSMVSTSQYSVYKTYNRSTYTATESVVVTMPNISDVNAALGKLSALANAYVTGVSAQLSADQVTQLRTQALKAALLNATEQAGELVSPMGVKMTNVSISGYVIRPYPVYALAAGGSAPVAKDVAPSFFGGTSKVSESISAVFSYG